MPESEIVYLGLGSNQGDREQLMAQAIEMLSVALGAPVRLSSTIETEAWGFVSPNPFLNMVACFSTDVPPMELLQITEDVERRLGRRTKSVGGVYSDRPIDIDILFYGDRIISTERLTVPHPRLQERLFVLAPLAEISPRLMHPLLGKSVLQLRDSILSAPDSNA
jgi:2-amino-4-hydroxy-6-hydroxymethyldihydropteridine diphosphokinase